MNAELGTLRRILKMPWLATVRPRGWWRFPLVIWFAWVLILGQGGGDAQAGSWRHWGLITLVAGIATLWMLIVPNVINLRRDAHVLRMPRVVREADWCLIGYGLLTVVLPALLLGAIFGHTLALTALLLLIASVALAGRLLPAMWTVALMIVLAIAYIFSLSGRLILPALDARGFLAWAAPAAIVCTVLAAWRWIALRKVTELGVSTWTSLGVFNTRRIHTARLGGTTFKPSYSSHAARTARDSAISLHHQLRRVGPEYPVRSLRALLDAQIKPWGLVDTGRPSFTVARIVAVVVAACAALVFLGERQFGRMSLLRLMPTGLVLMGILMAGFWRIWDRYLSANGRDRGPGVAVAALLPGLGSPIQVKRRALLAWIQPNLHWTLGIGLAATAICLLLRVPALIYVYLALMATAGIVAGSAMVANTLGGCEVPRMIRDACYFIGLVLAGVTAFWGVQGLDYPHESLSTPSLPAAVCIALWVVWLILLAALAWRGWRVLQTRPHPFLPNTRS